MSTISNGMKKRFVKDTGIPIQIFEEPYFTYYLDLYDKIYNTRSKFELLQNAITSVGGEEQLFEHRDHIIGRILTTIREREGYKVFDAPKFDPNIPITKEFGRRDLFTDDHDKHSFFSIDLRQANFQCLYRFDPAIFEGAKDFTSYIQRYTNIPHFIECKSLRQLIFGNLNPKRQQSFQRAMMEDVLAPLINRIGLTPNDAFFVSSDELIIRYRHGTDYDISEAWSCYERIASILWSHFINNHIDIRINIELFDVHKLHPQNMFVKHVRIADPRVTSLSLKQPNRFILRLVPAHFVPQLIRYVEGTELTDADLLFYYERMLCRWMEPLKFDTPFCDLIGGKRLCR